MEPLSTTTRMGKDNCPFCNSILDAATNIDVEQPVPLPGDVTLCGKCGELLQFGKDMALELPTEQALSELTPEQLYNLNEISLIVKSHAKQKA
jgi:hypothetical protein